MVRHRQNKLTPDHCHSEHHKIHKDDHTLRALPRTALIFTGMILPVGLSFLVGHHD